MRLGEMGDLTPLFEPFICVEYYFLSCRNRAPRWHPTFKGWRFPAAAHIVKLVCGCVEINRKVSSTSPGASMKKTSSALLALFTAFGAQAATVTFTDSYGLATTTWTRMLGAGQFNGTLGTLNSATFSFRDDIVQRIKAENTGAVAVTITAVAGTEFLFRKNSATLQTTNIVSTGASFAASAFDGVSDFAGTSGIDFGDLTASSTSAITLTGAALADLIGIGTLGSVGFDVRARGTGAISPNNGNLDSSIATQARYNLTLVYDYTPTGTVPAVPEPETWALMSLGLAGVGFAARRRKV